MTDRNETVRRLSVATRALTEATYPLDDPDLYEDPRVVAFIHAVNNFAGAVLSILDYVYELEMR